VDSVAIIYGTVKLKKALARISHRAAIESHNALR